MTFAAEVKLGEVAEFVRGITFKPDDVVPLGTDASVACMRTKNVQDVLDCSDVWAVPAELVRRQDQMLGEGDILVSSANSWNLVGKCSWIPKLNWLASFGGFVSVLRANPQKVEPRFLYRWFSWDRTQAILRSFGQKTTNISNLNIERCLNMKLCLPPLPEQSLIAAILDQTDALRTKRREALALLDELQRGIFIEMFGDLFLNTNGYPVSRLGNLCDVRDGTHDSPKFLSKGYPLVTTKNLRNGRIDFSDVSLISEEDYLAINKRSKVDKGDILMPMIGTIGNPIRVDVNPEFAIKNMALIKFIELSPDPQFILQFLKSDCFDRLVAKKNKGGTQKFLALGEIRELPVPVPPKAAQEKFAALTAELRSHGQKLQASLEALDALFASLQYRAFQGAL